MSNIVKCRICGFEGESLVTHLKYKHGVAPASYKEMYGDPLTIPISEEVRQRMSDLSTKWASDPINRKKSSEAQLNGASIYTVKYWMNRKGFTLEEAKAKISEMQKKNSAKRIETVNIRETSHFCEEYWIKRGLSLSDAKAEISKVQAKLSARSSKFLGHTRTPEGKKRISDSMKKKISLVGKATWAMHFGEFDGRSKVEVEFYDCIKSTINSSVAANVPIGDFIVDVIAGKKVVEFYGDFWHANPLKYKPDHELKSHYGDIRVVSDVWERDRKRIQYLVDSGYEVMIVWEMDWHKNREDCLNKLRSYLA
jgi:hypothetical protein